MMQVAIDKLAKALQDKRGVPSGGRGGRTLRAVAPEVGISSTTFSNIECRKVPPDGFRISTLGRLCAWLGRPITDFLEPAAESRKRRGAA